MPEENRPTFSSASQFNDTRGRNTAAYNELESIFDSRSGVDKEEPSLDDDAQAVLDDLIEPLLSDPPASSQAAEAALTLALFSLVENRVLNLRDLEDGDLNDNMRVAGDRTVGDRLCRQILAPRNIPATQGPFQSSSFRAGYLAPQVRNASLRRYVNWQSDAERAIDEVRVMADALADAFLARASSMPPLPSIKSGALTFTTFRRVVDGLLAEGSGGAFEQYLLAGLLNEELAASSAGLRAVTKNVGASDAASSAAGDIEVRQGHALRGAIEVTAASWDDKLDQLGVAADASLSEATIAAPGVTASVTGEELAEKLDPVASRLGLDVAVVDLHALMDIASSRITKAGRAEAIRFVYRCLARYHRREPHLAERLIDVLSDLGLVESVPSDHPESAPVNDVDEVITKVRDLLATEGIAGNPETPNALIDLAHTLRRVHIPPPPAHDD